MHNINQKETTSNNNNELSSFLYCKAILNEIVNNAIRTPKYRKFYKNGNYVKNFTILSTNNSLNLTPKVYSSISQLIEVNSTEISNHICDNKTIEHENNIHLLNNNIHKIKSNSEIKKFSILQVQNNNLNNQNIKIHENSTTKLITINNDSNKSFIKYYNSSEISGLKMSQLENNDTLRTEKLEIEIKKLIEEINANENNKKNVDTYLDGQGDVDVKLNRKSFTNNNNNNRNDYCGLNTKIRSESEFIIDENDTIVTRKFCRTDLLNHDNKLHMACNELLLLPEMNDIEFEQDYWERSQEHELQVTYPEYSDSEEYDTDLQTFEAYGGEFFDIDLCCVTKIPQISDDSDTDNDATNRVEFRKPQEIVEKTNVDDVVKPKSKKFIDLKSNNEKKSKKKRVWSLGNRIINFFTNKNRTSSNLHAGANKI